MTKVYIFIDESGDPGFDLEQGASSKHYAELALQLTHDGLNNMISHLINWKYVLGKYFEYKGLPNTKQVSRYIKPFEEMYNRQELCCSCVYLLKAQYTGPYLKPNSHGGAKPLWFRNFVHRKLLEYHFNNFPPQEDQETELIFDQYKMTMDETRNLEDYLINNWNLPNLDHICHVNSVYTEAIQIASQLVNTAKDIILETANEQTKKLLSFIKLQSITHP